LAGRGDIGGERIGIGDVVIDDEAAFPVGLEAVADFAPDYLEIRCRL